MCQIMTCRRPRYIQRATGQRSALVIDDDERLLAVIRTTLRLATAPRYRRAVVGDCGASVTRSAEDHVGRLMRAPAIQPPQAAAMPTHARAQEGCLEAGRASRRVATAYLALWRMRGMSANAPATEPATISCRKRPHHQPQAPTASEHSS